MRRIPPQVAAWIWVVVLGIVATPVRAAQPVTITFEDIFNKPLGHDSLPPFTWQGVLFTGGGLHRTPEWGTWYEARRRNAIELKFPAGSTDISFDVDGRGQSLLLFEYMPIQVWQGEIGDTLIQTLPIPLSLAGLVPPKHEVKITGPASLVTIFTALPPSGISDYSNFIYLDNIRYTPPDPEPAITFDTVLPAHARVLTHNYGAYPYPSPLQTQDGAIRVQATVLVNGQPAPGKTIHFRLIDPPDTAPYVRQAGDDKFGDNFDGPGSLNAPGQTTTTAVSDGAGRIFATLRTTSFASGDNYQIEASGNASFPCGPSCAKSAVYTAWKRVYVEYNKMFRRGAYITDNVTPGSKDIEVSDINPFPRTPFQVRLIHAPSVNGTSGASAFYSETVTIVEKESDSAWPFGVRPGTLHLDATPAVPGIQNAYYRGEVVGTSTSVRPYVADAVGLVTGDRSSDYFLLDARFIRETFDEAFVEHVWLTDAVGGVDTDLTADDVRLPYDGVLPYDTMIDAAPEAYKSEWLARKWMRNAQRAGQDRITRPNHFLIFTATSHPSDNGFNRVGSGFNDLWLFVRKIGNTVQMAESLVHEVGHNWRVNPVWQPAVPHPSSTGTGGHCNVAFGRDVAMYNRNLKCTMHRDVYGGDQSDPERSDGVVGFHYGKAGGSADSEYLRVRRRLEPVPQNDQQRTPPK